MLEQNSNRERSLQPNFLTNNKNPYTNELTAESFKKGGACLYKKIYKINNRNMDNEDSIKMDRRNLLVKFTRLQHFDSDRKKCEFLCFFRRCLVMHLLYCTTKYSRLLMSWSPYKKTISYLFNSLLPPSDPGCREKPILSSHTKKKIELLIVWNINGCQVDDFIWGECVKRAHNNIWTCTVEDIKNILDRLNIKKALGEDGITNNHLKEIPEECVK